MARALDQISGRLLSLLGSDGPVGEPSTWRRNLTALLTRSSALDIPEEAWPLLEELWRLESPTGPIARAAEIPGLTTDGRWTDSVSLWRGDITRLEAGAIVNAANSRLTGCYIPFHACVDNAIHTVAGPWLRRECELIMRERGRPEPVGTATATKAFYLPARFVLHTVGPVVKDSSPTKQDEASLARCYRACLDAAWELEVNSIAFCAISSGIFGYPKREAARVALRAIERFQVSCPPDPPLHVIIVAYTQDDENIYRAALESQS